jgi:peptide/nickel transport system permease protein
MKNTNRRLTSIIMAVIILTVLIAIYVSGALMSESALRADFSQKFLSPSFAHPFGTDYLGRDMFVRTIKGLSLSLTIGAIASGISAVIGLIVGTTAALGKGLIDHHTVLLIMISIALGQGATGLLIGIALTHWASLARLVRAEVLQIRDQQFVMAARRFGKSPFWIARKHILPHVVPQFFVGLILEFPHAIMHESGLTFLGFGMPPEQPAVGIILSESMRYISAGAWWLVVFPGLALVVLVVLIEALGTTVRHLFEPRQAQL